MLCYLFCFGLSLTAFSSCATISFNTHINTAELDMREYHHLGLVTTDSMEGEKFVPDLKIYVWGYDTSEYKIEWVRFAEGAEEMYHPLMMKLPHIAFKVDNLEEELKGKKVIWGPFESLPGFMVAFIEENGAPVELIETKLTEEELLQIVKERE